MSSSSCTGDLFNGLMSQPFTGGNDSSYYSCAFLSNYTLASKCCSPDKPHPFDDACYSWCDLPASMNSAFDSDEVDDFQYFMGCLNATGETIGPLWCHAQPHVIFNSATATRSSAPTSSFNSTAYCATNDPQSFISEPDSSPACGILPNTSNTLAFEACCQPAPVQWSVQHCYEVCGLPRGTAFRGEGNLTYDQALGSFKACLLQKANGSQSGLDGVFCRVNETRIDLRGTTFSTTQYLTGDAVARSSLRNAILLVGFMVLIVAL
jgi:hypothetical protein